jgi:PAS domain S-box-containing protein
MSSGKYWVLQNLIFDDVIPLDEAMTEPVRDISVDDDVTIITDLYGLVVSVISAVQKLFVYSESDLVEKNLEVLIPGDLRASHRDHMTRYARRPLQRLFKHLFK